MAFRIIYTRIYGRRYCLYLFVALLLRSRLVISTADESGIILISSFVIYSFLVVMASRGVFGSIEEFDSKRDDWELYEEKFNFFVEANDITDDKTNRAMLLAYVGMALLAYVRDLNMPTLLSDDSITFDKLIEQFRAHYGKKTASLAARNEFCRRRQEETQSVDEFAADLRGASLYCKFGNDLDVRLRDQFGIKLKSDAIRKRLMERDEITFPEALKFASSLDRIARESNFSSKSEASVSQVSCLRQQSHSTRPTTGDSNSSFGVKTNTFRATANQTSQVGSSGKRQATRGACWSCGSTAHRRLECPYYVNGYKCCECGEAGQKASVCSTRLTRQQ